ncbi:Plasmodium exported protein (hyp10), unknown, putative [Plasmodium sp.]|nr:Plasmodium exported protein (hyp10), unknown, putative [Plasmodium sp.]
MFYNYSKSPFISILLCFLIIPPQFYLDQITHNKTNTIDIINEKHKRLLAESHETNIFNYHSGENSLKQPIDNKLEDFFTEYHNQSSSCTLKGDIHQEHDSQTEQVELENETNNEFWFQKFHKKSHFKKIYIRLLLISPLPLSLIFYIAYSINKKNKKHKKNIHTDQVCVSDKNIDDIKEN